MRPLDCVRAARVSQRRSTMAFQADDEQTVLRRAEETRRTSAATSTTTLRNRCTQDLPEQPAHARGNRRNGPVGAPAVVENVVLDEVY